MLEKYAGKEEKLFAALVSKYGPEPEDPYYAQEQEDDDDDDLEEALDNLNLGEKKKRRGVGAKKAAKVDTRVVIQKISRNKKKAVTIVVGMDTVPELNLKDVAKAFSKRFAGSSSVKDGARGKEIIIQGDHMDDVAEMIVQKFEVPGDSVFLDVDGEFIPYK
jgi:density-regulated protein DRP1